MRIASALRTCRRFVGLGRASEMLRNRRDVSGAADDARAHLPLAGLVALALLRCQRLDTVALYAVLELGELAESQRRIRSRLTAPGYRRGGYCRRRTEAVCLGR
jgi:hypothetical protein